MNKTDAYKEPTLLEKQILELYHKHSINFGCPITNVKRCYNCPLQPKCPVRLEDQQHNKNTFEHLKTITIISRLKFQAEHKNNNTPIT